MKYFLLAVAVIGIGYLSFTHDKKVLDTQCEIYQVDDYLITC